MTNEDFIKILPVILKTSIEGLIKQTALKEAIKLDCQLLITKIEYRGKPMTINTFFIIDQDKQIIILRNEVDPGNQSAIMAQKLIDFKIQFNLI